MEFNVRVIRWVCTCGLEKFNVKVGVCSTGELAGQWRCGKCRKRITARIPFEQLIADIPPSPIHNGPIRPPLLVREGLTAEDVSFLAGMHISV